MRITLNYGKNGLDVKLPEAADPTVIRKVAMPILPDPVAAVDDALDTPVDGRTLKAIARTARTACILICDITRPVPNGLILGPMVRRLTEGGMKAENITILVATGLHRPNEGDELREVVGDDAVFEAVRVANHFGRNDADHVDLGWTQRGTHVRIDRRFVEADLRIVVGLVEPHFMAGYSGGRKLIAPGVAHAETITTFHNAAFMEHPKAMSCVIDGNPLHEEQLAIVKLVGGALAVNTVIDEERRLSFVNFGEIVASHLDAVAYTRAYSEVRLSRKFRTVLTSAAGYPLDRTYYQTVKGMAVPFEIVAQGGDLIIVADCSEGMGSEAYADAQRRYVARGIEGFMAEIIEKKHAAIDEWQTEMQIRIQRVGNVYLYAPNLPADCRDLTGVILIDSVEQALAESLERQGDREIAVIPEGPYVVPLFDASAAPHE